MSRPAVSKDADVSFDVLTDFTAEFTAGCLRTDNSKELIAAGEMLRKTGNFQIKFAVPYRAQSNSLAERWGQEVLRGTRALLRQSRFPLQFWSWAITAFTTAYNCQ